MLQTAEYQLIAGAIPPELAKPVQDFETLDDVRPKDSGRFLNPLKLQRSLRKQEVKVDACHSSGIFPAHPSAVGRKLQRRVDDLTEPHPLILKHA